MTDMPCSSPEHGQKHRQNRGQEHGVAIALAVDCDGPLAGVLILGDSGAGKSTLAIAATEDCPWRRTRLVADDIVVLHQDNAALFASAPTPLKNRMEVFGYGPITLRTQARVKLRIAFNLTAALSRYPAPARYHAPDALKAPAAPLTEGGIPLYPFDLTAPAPGARLRMTVRALFTGQTAERAHHRGPSSEEKNA